MVQEQCVVMKGAEDFEKGFGVDIKRQQLKRSLENYGLGFRVVGCFRHLHHFSLELAKDLGTTFGSKMSAIYTFPN